MDYRSSAKCHWESGPKILFWERVSIQGKLQQIHAGGIAFFRGTYDAALSEVAGWKRYTAGKYWATGEWSEEAAVLAVPSEDAYGLAPFFHSPMVYVPPSAMFQAEKGIGRIQRPFSIGYCRQARNKQLALYAAVAF